MKAIILFIQMDLQKWNMHKHKRRDLSHEPSTAKHNQSFHRHCLLSCGFPHSFSVTSKQTHHKLWGVCSNSVCSGETREMLTPAVTLPAGVAVGQCFFRRMSNL